MNRSLTIMLSALCLAASLCGFRASACTSAIISAGATADGRPLLWKNRDTSATDNKVETIVFTDGRLSYTALFNASDRDCREAWMGMNINGFAIMNTASYNLKADKVPAKDMDSEGEVMSLALSTCVTVDDFARLLDKLPRPMGVEANFGVIDALGNGAYFETDNYSYRRFDLKDAPEGYMVRTNYSHSGREGEGYGFTREKDALHLLGPVAVAHAVTPEFLTETLSRSFYNDSLGRDMSQESGLVVDEGFIPRFKTTASIVVEGCHPLTDESEITPEKISREYIMWTALGYPPCATVTPVWMTPDGVDDSLRGIQSGGTSAASDRAKALRDKVFVKKGGEKPVYIDMGQLFRADGSGICQRLKKENLEIYRIIKSRRDRSR